MDPLNRVALIVRPKRRYKAWADSVAEGDEDPIFDLDAARASPAVYLVAAPGGTSLPELLDEYAAEIFEEQLEAWHLDESAWPINRSLHVFRDWFDVDLGDAVVDLDPEEPFGFESDDEDQLEGDVDDDLDSDLEDDDSFLVETLAGMPDHMQFCGWCGARIPEDAPVLSVSLKGPRDPHPAPELIQLPVGGRVIRAIVPSDDSAAAREGTMALVMFCSNDCGGAFRNAWNRERGALGS